MHGQHGEKEKGALNKLSSLLNDQRRDHVWRAVPSASAVSPRPPPNIPTGPGGVVLSFWTDALRSNRGINYLDSGRGVPIA